MVRGGERMETLYFFLLSRLKVSFDCHTRGTKSASVCAEYIRVLILMFKQMCHDIFFEISLIFFIELLCTLNINNDLNLLLHKCGTVGRSTFLTDHVFTFRLNMPCRMDLPGSTLP